MKKNLLAFCLSLVAFVASFELCAQGLTRRTLPNRRAAPAARTEPAAEQDAEADSADPTEPPALNWDAAPVDIVFQAYGEQVGKTILKDPAVPAATITLKSREGQKLSKTEYLEAIEVVLEMNGIHLEPYGEKFMRAVPRGKARKEGIPLYMDIMDVPEDAKDGKVISVMISFKSIATDEAQKALEGFKSDTGVLNVFERTNAILVTDTWLNIKTMDEIAKAIDISSPVLEQVFVYQVENASAEEIKTALEQIVQESQKELEKSGGGVQNNVNNRGNMVQPTSLGGGRLLRNRNNQQPEQPKSVESVVTTMSDADRGMIRGKVLILADERSNKLVIITSKSNYDFFEKIIRQLDVETTPDTVVKVYRLKYAEAEEVSDMINDLIGNAPSAKNSSKGNQNAAAKGQGGTTRVSSPTGQSTARKSSNQRTGEAKAGELSKENTTVLADKRINGLVVMTNKELVPVIEGIIEAMDVKLSQVLIETVIIEVTLGDGLNTGIDWVQRGRAKSSTQVQRQNAMGQPLYYMTRTESRPAEGETTAYSSTSLTGDVVPAGYSRSYTENGITYTDTASTYGVFDTVTSLVRDGFVNNGSYGLGGGGGSAAGTALLGTVMNATTNATSAYFGGATPIGAGINYILKSDKLNLAAVIQASKTDSRAKYIASPIVMTVDNKEATIEATQSRKFYSGSTSTSGTYGGNPTVTYNYSDKDIGIKIKVTPKINPNGTVMLEIEEEYSQLGAKQEVLVSSSSGNPGKENIDTSLTRKMSADILLENMQTVVLGGLTETYTSSSETGIPLLKDIPWIGKWLFGTVSQTEDRKELLVFMTPYVLDEGSAAQAEALRRKRSLSDTRPWEDHGWSASPLADPVSKQEQMRRLKDEWKKQDEERKTKLAIEEEKVKRAKALEGMTKAEQERWLKMHKDELDEADRDDEVDALEEKMKSKDDDTQEELRKLAAEIREKKLKKAQEEIDAADEAAKSDNEYQKLKAAEAAKAEAEKPAEPEGKPAEPEAKPAEPAEKEKESK